MSLYRPGRTLRGQRIADEALEALRTRWAPMKRMDLRDAEREFGIDVANKLYAKRVPKVVEEHSETWNDL